MVQNKFFSLDEVKDARGNPSKSKIYKDIGDELLPPPVKWGVTSLWPAREIDIINEAVIAGATTAEIRQLVKALIAARTTASDALNQMRQAQASEARYGDAANAPAQQKKHAAGTHPTTTARRNPTRHKASIKEEVRR